MKAGSNARLALHIGTLAGALFAVAWLLVLTLPPLPGSEFSELEAQRNAEMARRSSGEVGIWNHQPIIIAGRRIGPFESRAVSLLTLTTLPAFVVATRQVQPELAFGLPLLKQESWRAFYLILIYSAAMWFAIGWAGTRVARALRHLLGRRASVSQGAG